ncbi:MAG: threonine--tRNA ligase [Bdellovibrionales bacterium]|nr:threonine--tRNA ligase [Bdellovibrionales bacterium]
MSTIRIILPDNSTREFNHEPTVLEVAESIGSRLAKDTVGGLINDEREVCDLRRQLKNQDRLKIVTLQMPESLEVIRHSAAHVMAQAVQELWPEVKVTIGPVIDNGFYYDFGTDQNFTPEMLTQIEKRIEELLKQNTPLVREELSAKEAIATFEKLGESFKVELIRDLGAASVSIYRQGKWFDLCRGPHVQHLGQIKAVKLLSVAGAYWRGDEKREQLQRIYATAFNDKKDLKEYLDNLEEAKKRDHRKLGKELGLFAFHQFSPGGPFFTPKGTIIYNQLQTYLRERYRHYGYQEVITPQIFDVDLYHKSGHYENYRENMYFTKIDERDFSVKPMNCPGHCLLYASERKSYRDLPFRIADFGRLHRYERSGVMHGLTRVRTFCQDDAHIFCSLTDMQREIRQFMQFLAEVYQKLGLTEYQVYLSTRPPKRMGSDAVWDQAENALEQALKELKLPYKINPGDGAFYGPKLDIMFVDALKRPWQLGTIQCDFNMPESFDLIFVGDDNKEHRPVMLHRAILGSLERFIGVYLEHTAGHLPTWLAPVQVAVLNVTDRQAEYCQSLVAELEAEGLRAQFDERSEKLGFKIREAQLQKVPYMLIIGDKELEANTVSVRLRNGEMKNNLTRREFADFIKNEVSDRLLTSPWLEKGPSSKA